jgi:membrane protein implicated in regulation of membrane protease activity
MQVAVWVLWACAAVFFMIAEMLTPGFFLFWLGVGAACSAMAAFFFGVGLVGQLLIFIIVSASLFAASRKFAASKKQPDGIGADRIVGQECMVLEDISYEKHSGKVRLGSEEWRADSSVKDQSIPAGLRVKVLRVDGTHLIVEKI